MEPEVIATKLEALEEFRKEQLALNRDFIAALHRIEIAVNRSVDKACPKPGLCVEIETMWRAKWENDKARFEHIDERFLANDKWHQEHDEEIKRDLDKIRGGVEENKALFLRASGAIGVLIFLMPWLVTLAKAYFSHTP